MFVVYWKRFKNGVYQFPGRKNYSSFACEKSAREWAEKSKQRDEERGIEFQYNIVKE